MEEQNSGIKWVVLEILLVVIAVLLVLRFFGNITQDEQTPTPIPTMTPTSSPVPTNTPTPTFTPTPSPSPTPTPIPGVRKEVDQGHKFKPYTRHFVYDVKGTAQCKLQSIAYTDERTGIRVVDDPLGEPRYCVALGTYWCGGHPQHIGRCVDVYMVNGAVLKCVLADVKRQEDTKNRANRYGEINNDVLEFIVDGKALPDAVKYYGNVSKAGKEFEGDAAYMIVYDMWIDGFGDDWNK